MGLWGWVVGDMQKGVQKTEEMLVKGSTITGIGEVVSGPMGVRLQPPTDGKPFYLVKNSLSSLIKEVEGSRTVLKVCLGVFGGIGLLVSSLAAWKLYKKRNEEEAGGRNKRGEGFQGAKAKWGRYPRCLAVCCLSWRRAGGDPASLRPCLCMCRLCGGVAEDEPGLSCVQVAYRKCGTCIYIVKLGRFHVPCPDSTCRNRPYSKPSKEEKRSNF